MKLAELTSPDIARRLGGEGLTLRIGPFVFRLRSTIGLVVEALTRLYEGYEVVEDPVFADFTVTVGPGAGLRRWIRPQARFLFDGRPVFEPLPLSQAFPLLEWSMNWCISNYAHQFLLIHAAVVERKGLALILPAPPGSGKSTLCAALVHSGWRLLSDELTMVSLQDGRIHPLCRPVSLKNASIDVIGRFAPAAVFSRISHETAKGSVTHMRVLTEHLAQMHVPAAARWVVFPRYEAGASTTLAARSRAESMVELARNAFNFAVLGRPGFERLGDVIEGCDCYDFRYSRLPEAIAAFDALAAAA